MRRIIGLGLFALLAVAFAYVSRFWVLDLWGRDGLFGIAALRSGGDLWRRWMNDLGLATYDVLLWVIAVFLCLTLLQKLWDRATRDH